MLGGEAVGKLWLRLAVPIQNRMRHCQAQLVGGSPGVGGIRRSLPREGAMSRRKQLSHSSGHWPRAVKG